MTPHHQKILTKNGDCYRTAIACILDVDPEEVPHISESLFDHPQCALVQNGLLNKWLRKRYGLQLVEIPMFAGDGGVPSPECIIEQILNGTPQLEGHFIIAGNARGSERVGRSHAVVYGTDGSMHDPHPSGNGLDRPIKLDDGREVYWLTLLVKC